MKLTIAFFLIALLFHCSRNIVDGNVGLVISCAENQSFDKLIVFFDKGNKGQPLLVKYDKSTGISEYKFYLNVKEQVKKALSQIFGCKKEYVISRLKSKFDICHYETKGNDGITQIGYFIYNSEYCNNINKNDKCGCLEFSFTKEEKLIDIFIFPPYS